VVFVVLLCFFGLAVAYPPLKVASPGDPIAHPFYRKERRRGRGRLSWRLAERPRINDKKPGVRWIDGAGGYWGVVLRVFFGRGKRVGASFVHVGTNWYSWVYCGSRGRFGAKQGRRFEVQKAEDSGCQKQKIRRAKRLKIRCGNG
jgi:hypothetical protein